MPANSNSTLTFTGQLGPGNSVTAYVFSDVTEANFNFANGTLQITHGTPKRTQTLELSNIATLTDTITAGVHALVLST